MQLITGLAALAAFKVTVALPAGSETGVATYTLVDPADIPEAYKTGVVNETDITARHLDKRDGPFGVYFCSDPDFTGVCWHQVTTESKKCRMYTRTKRTDDHR